MAACITEFHQRRGSVENGLFDLKKNGMSIKVYWNLPLFNDNDTVISVSRVQHCEWSEISHKSNKVCLIDLVPL